MILSEVVELILLYQVRLISYSFMKITKVFMINMREHVYTVDGEIFMGEIHTCISWAKFSRDPIFADGCPHEIFEPNINFCFRKVAHMQMAEAVMQKALCICDTITRTFGKWQLVKQLCSC